MKKAYSCHEHIEREDDRDKRLRCKSHERNHREIAGSATMPDTRIESRHEEDEREKQKELVGGRHIHDQYAAHIMGIISTSLPASRNSCLAGKTMSESAFAIPVVMLDSRVARGTIVGNPSTLPSR